MRALLFSGLLLFLVSSASVAGAIGLGDLLVTDLSRRAVFQVDAVTGNRTVLSGCSDASCSSLVGGGASLFAPASVARRSTTDLASPIYVTDTLTDSLIRIDPSTGFRTVVSSSVVGSGPSFVSPTSVSVQSSGNLLVVDESLSTIFEVDATTGNRTVLTGCSDSSCSSEIGVGDSLVAPHDLSIMLSGNSFVLDQALDAVLGVDGSIGARSVLSSSSDGSGPSFVVPRNLAVAQDGNLYVTDSGFTPASPGAIYRVDPVTGDRVIVADGNIGTGRDFEVPVDLVVNGAGDLFVIDFAPGIILKVDPDTGNRFIVSSSQQGTGLSFEAPSGIALVPVPEPSTALLIGLGCALLARHRRSADTGWESRGPPT